MLDAEARKRIAGASRIELRRDGRAVVDLHFADTPGLVELEACVLPDLGYSDSK